ncbi:hypothetical protein KIH39_15065 [Telmatocola sphagniphila]|uniref:PSP1 C-terminal domain-containing protein n=1 Tax=Telmatocola sphagniphila TaxID=1123043 RepID=A0A8E6B2N8_9BACT|nr:hypothetical protein [Telmatocola sphagniphila]QVL30174.1 hypothetical protein KIH39_15065 [Telmatocola sphagniphila]
MNPRYIISFGKSAFVGVFPASPDCMAPIPRETSVVLQTERGLEYGLVLGTSDAPATAQRLLLRPFNEQDERKKISIEAREKELFSPISEWCNQVLPSRILLDVELLFDDETVLLFGFWSEADLTEELISSFAQCIRMKPLFYDVQSELIVEKQPAGCGKEGCGSSGGGCSSCGDGKSGCSSGSCSRGSVKDPEEFKDYLLKLREKMVSSPPRTPLLG